MVFAVHAGACPATSGEEAARRLEPGGSAPDSGAGPHSCLSRLSENHLQLWTAFEGRLPSSNNRHRFGPDVSPHSWKGRQGQVCATGGPNTEVAAGILDNSNLHAPDHRSTSGHDGPAQ